VSKNKEIEEIATSKKSLQNFEENDDQNWIIKTLFILQPFSLTKTLCSKDMETLNDNRTPIFSGVYPPDTSDRTYDNIL